MKEASNQPRAAIGYARVSTSTQAKNGISLEMQRTKIEQWCALHEYDLVGIFEDAGVSGTREDRPALAKALNAVRKNSVVVCYRLDRLGRSTLHVLELAKRIGALGADLVSLSENLDSTTPGGKLMFTVFAAVAQFERDTIAERISDGLQDKLSRGEAAGGVPKYGSKLAHDKRRRNRKTGQPLLVLKPNPGELAIVKRARRLHARGKSLREIAAKLTEAGYKPRGSRWHPQTIANILAA